MSRSKNLMIALLMAVFAGCVAEQDELGSTEEEIAAQEAAYEEIEVTADFPAMCGGIASIPCETGKVCVDDPRDTCDPKSGGADCSGICVKPRWR